MVDSRRTDCVVLSTYSITPVITRVFSAKVVPENVLMWLWLKRRDALEPCTESEINYCLFHTDVIYINRQPAPIGCSG